MKGCESREFFRQRLFLVFGVPFAKAVDINYFGYFVHPKGGQVRLLNNSFNNRHP